MPLFRELSTKAFPILAALLLAACTSGPSDRGYESTPIIEGVEFAPLDHTATVVADGFITPFAIAVLNDDEYLVTDRPGQLFHVQNGQANALDGLPEIKNFEEGRRPYGGLMDVSLHPRFSNNRQVYITYVNGDWNLTVARFRFIEETIQDFEVIFEANAFSSGSRIEWQDDEHFFLTMGMGRRRMEAQELDSDDGKIHRLMADGSIPPDNPVFEGQTESSSIWTRGHRAIQGMYLDRDAGVLYAIEHGPRGGDELNIIEKGGNYGWPLFSYGMHYDGSPVDELSEAEAAEQTVMPFKWWPISFHHAPSGLERVALPRMGSRLVWGAMVQQRLIAFDTDTMMTSVIADNMGRIRDVTQLPDGDLLIAVDTESSIKTYAGKVVRLSFE